MLTRTVFEPEHEAFRANVRTFLEEEVVPEYADWITEGRPSARFWKGVGALGALGIGVPEE